MASHNIRIELDDEQEKFLKWLAKRDGITVKEELTNMFYTEFHALEDLFEDEYKESI